MQESEDEYVRIAMNLAGSRRKQAPEMQKAAQACAGRLLETAAPEDAAEETN